MTSQSDPSAQPRAATAQPRSIYILLTQWAAPSPRVSLSCFASPEALRAALPAGSRIEGPANLWFLGAYPVRLSQARPGQPTLTVYHKDCAEYAAPAQP
jgi:hypothetical protein